VSHKNLDQLTNKQWQEFLNAISNCENLLNIMLSENNLGSLTGEQ
jgi:hypothetical protein